MDIVVNTELPVEEQPQPAPAPAAQDPPQVQHYKAVDLDAALAPTAFLPVEKIGGTYFAHLATPLLVQTPPLTLESPLDDDDGTPLPHAHVTLPRAFQQFAQATEQLVMEACLANKDTWFRRPRQDQSLRASFKQFFKPSSGGVLKIKVPRDCLVFDAQGQVLDREELVPGCTFRAILELGRVCFGRTEFGAMWTLVQAQTAPPAPPPPRCLIDPGVDADTACGSQHDVETEVHEFS